MTKTLLLATVALVGLSAPAFAGGCCDGIPAPVQRFLMVSEKAPAPAATETPADAPAGSATEATPAASPDSIAPASGGEAVTDQAAPPADEPEAAADSDAAPAEGTSPDASKAQ